MAQIAATAAATSSQLNDAVPLQARPRPPHSRRRASSGDPVSGSQSLGAAAVWAAAGAWALLGMHASVTDLRRRVISRRACWTAAITITLLLVTAALAYGSPGQLLRLAIGVVPVLVAGEALYRVRPAAIGYGDIRLINASSILVAWWGLQWPWWALLGGTALAVPQAIAARTRHGTTATIAWAPALAAGTTLVVITRLIAHGTTP
ncbi:MAG: hypothetical protein F4064_00690 [Acidimicrobiales bacterium]|nr:hypothetical protein [Acidimicrobiales bacterium]